MIAIDFPRFGMGAAGIGNLYRAVSDSDAEATIETAWRGGLRYFDTAPYYGFGLSEERLGRALARLDPEQSALISTKVGRLLDPVDAPARERHGFVDGGPFEPRFDYGRDAVLRSHDESLARLRRDRVGVLLAHDLGRLTHGGEADRHMRDFLDEGYPAMMALKEQGAIDAVGIGVNETEVCAFLLDRVELDVILLAGRYTLLDRRAADHILPLCAERGVKVVVGGPYNSGILAVPTREQADPHFDYESPSARTMARTRMIEEVCEAHGVPLPVAALHFPLRHPAVACVIPGMSSSSEVAEGLERMAADVPASLWTALGDSDYVNANAEPDESSA